MRIGCIFHMGQIGIRRPNARDCTKQRNNADAETSLLDTSTPLTTSNFESSAYMMLGRTTPSAIANALKSFKVRYGRRLSLFRQRGADVLAFALTGPV